MSFIIQKYLHINLNPYGRIQSLTTLLQTYIFSDDCAFAFGVGSHSLHVLCKSLISVSMYNGRKLYTHVQTAKHIP